MNAWNRIHRGVCLTYFAIVGLLVAVVALAVFAPGMLPASPRAAGGLVALLIGVALATLRAVDKQARQRMDPAPRGMLPVACGFCGRSQVDLPVLMAGPEQYVCAECVDSACVLTQPNDIPAGGPTQRCSFCKADRPVGAVFLRGLAAICSDCARIAREAFKADAASVSDGLSRAAQQAHAPDGRRAAQGLFRAARR